MRVRTYAFWLCIAAGLVITAALLPRPAFAAACDLTLAEVVRYYAKQRVPQVAVYRDIQPGGSGHADAVADGHYIEGADMVHVFGDRRFIVYVVTAGECVVGGNVEWSPERGTPA